MNKTLVNDTIITWNPLRLKEIDEAKSEFLKYRSLGHIIVKIDGTRMTSFEPSAGHMTILEEKFKENGDFRMRLGGKVPQIIVKLREILGRA